MARIDRARLDKGVFPHRCEVATRWSDLDQLGHVNNVAAALILQEGRYRFVIHTGLPFDTPDRHQLVVASSHIEYAADLLSPQPIEVSTGVLEMGRTSFRLAHLARQAERTGIYAEIVQVVRNAQGPAPIPDEWRSRLERMMIG
jgi:acyl-CoA thioester hydrolase